MVYIDIKLKEIITFLKMGMPIETEQVYIEYNNAYIQRRI